MRSLFDAIKHPKNMKMTPARKAALQQGFSDGGELIIGGSDQTVPRPRQDVIDALLAMGFLRPPVGSSYDCYKFTEKAFAYSREPRQSAMLMTYNPLKKRANRWQSYR
jgi:hypothetical protein